MECCVDFRLVGAVEGERGCVVRREEEAAEDAADGARVERGVERGGRLLVVWSEETEKEVAMVEERSKGRLDVERGDRE